MRCNIHLPRTSHTRGDTHHVRTSLPHQLCFEPKSVAVIGASDREKFGRQCPLQEHSSIRVTKDASTRSIPQSTIAIQGVQAYKSIEEISARVLKWPIVVTRPQTVPKIIEQCGRSGVKNAIVIITRRLLPKAGHSGAALERKMMEIARSYGVRLLGPNCLGIIRPTLGLNATFAQRSMPTSATWRWCLAIRARSAQPFSTGRPATASAFPASSRWVAPRMSISARSSTT
jgi:hypothetical protein